MENNISNAFASPDAPSLRVREALLRICHQYQDPALGQQTVEAAGYYARWLNSLPLPTPASSPVSTNKDSATKPQQPQ